VETTLDVELHHQFWESDESARLAALKEAANTGAAVISIDSVDIQSTNVSFVGTIPEAAIDCTNPGSRTEPRLGTFHSTWGAVLRPKVHLGYLVVQHPITFDRCIDSTTSDLARVAVTLKRIFHTVPVTALGPVCCKRCNHPVSAKRLAAIPGTKLCTNCQQSFEEMHHGN